jgi:RNA polymerase sigma-70 factor, ECF subfamily
VKPSDGHDRELQYREFVRLLAEHERQLAGYVHAMIPLWQDAEDVLQETKLRLWEQYDSFQAGTNFAAWAFTIAGFMVRTHRKRRQRERVCFSDDLVEKLSHQLSTMHASKSDMRLVALQDCVKSLNSASRRLLRLVCEGQRKIKDIAADLSQTPEATRVALFRIRQSLAECIKARLRKEGNR